MILVSNITHKFRIQTDKQKCTHINPDWLLERLAPVEDGKHVPFWVGRFSGSR